MKSLPEWVQELARKYFTRTISQFILHGNIMDFVRAEDADGKPRYLKLKDYLVEELFRRRDVVITYDRAAGIQFSDANVRRDFTDVFLPNFDMLHNSQYAKGLPADPPVIFGLLESYFMTRLRSGKKIGFIIDYAETLVPMAGNNYSSAADRAILVFLQRWAKESLFLNSDMTTLLVTENLNQINQQLVRNPYTAAIDVEYPQYDERRAFAQYYIDHKPHTTQKMEMTPDVFAHNTAGLNLVQIKTMLAEISEGRDVFTFEALTNRKKEVIESEAAGMLEFVESRFGLDDVAGHKAAKKHLREAARAIRAGRHDVMPMGYLVNGPVGTGKTFMVTCFANEIGVPMVSLKNFRSQWVGVTEANLEKALKLLKAMTPVAVMIDEADAYLGNRSQGGDSGVSSRVFSMIASFMSNTDHRGKIIWFLLTARPDYMPVDLKRQGRAEEHIALFYPETLAERKELFEVMLRKTGISDIKADDFADEFFNNLTILSGADMEAALTRAKFRAAAMQTQQPVAAGAGSAPEAAASEGESKPEAAQETAPAEGKVTSEVVKAVFEDFLPPAYPEEVELMNYVAVLECTSKELLPEKFRELSRAEIIQRINEIKANMRNI